MNSNQPMTSIIKAIHGHPQLLSGIATCSFIESYGCCASTKDVHAYEVENYNTDTIRKEFLDTENLYLL